LGTIDHRTVEDRAAKIRSDRTALDVHHPSFSCSRASPTNLSRCRARDRLSACASFSQRTKPNAFTPFAGIQCAEVSCGEGFCAVLSYEGGIFTWGSGSFGKLGHGGLWDEKNPRQVMTLSKRRAILLACGANHVVAVTDNGSLWAWGDGRYGQLGTGALADSGRPTKVKKIFPSFQPSLFVGRPRVDVGAQAMASVWTALI
jgi:alpha-tubulin suppressor-like RCC1 family protein